MIVTTENKNYTENSIRTFTGKVFDLKILDPESICIEDIAHALAQTARFAGHLKRFYSVAQHSVLMAENVSEDFKLEALLHDASEAYLGDMPSPFKRMMPEYKQHEIRLMKVIAGKYNIPFPLSGHVKYWDKQILQIEWDCFVECNSNYIIHPWSIDDAEQRFLEMYKELTLNIRL